MNHPGAFSTVQDLIIFLRLRCRDPDKDSATYLSYSLISELTGILSSIVKTICTFRSQKAIASPQQQKLGKLSNENVDYLTNQSTLQSQAGMTLSERCVMFHRKYPEKRLSPSKLSKLYRDCGIKRKFISIRKYMSPLQNHKTQELYLEMRYNIANALQQGRKVVFIDEVMFTYSTNLKQEFSNPYQNIEVKDKLQFTKSIAVVAGVSPDRVLELYYSYERSVDIEKFYDFLIGLQEQNTENRLAIVLDNLRVHHSKRIKALSEQLNMTLIFTPPYSPQYNPIENYFSVLKNQFKRMKMKIVGQEQRFDAKQVLRNAFISIDDGIIKEICKKKLKKFDL